MSDSINNDHTETHGGAAHGSVEEYKRGLYWSLGLTAIPFALVMIGGLSPSIIMLVVLLCAVAQIFVQLVFFLHMNTSSEQSWNVISGVFIVLIVLIVVLGSVWIMQHLNHNMLMGH